MRETKYYEVAGHGFSVTAEADCFGLMQNYTPFEITTHQIVFALSIDDGKKPAYVEEFRQRRKRNKLSFADIRPDRRRQCMSLSGEAKRPGGWWLSPTIATLHW